MAIYFNTQDPSGLLHEFDKRIAQTEAKGEITTWEKLSDGSHYTHKSANWKEMAFLKASVGEGCLIFNTIRP